MQPGDVRGSAHGFVTPLLRRHVYGIDCSSIIEQATEIVKINGFAVRVLPACGFGAATASVAHGENPPS